MPFLYKVLNLKVRNVGTLIILLICLVANVVCSFTHIPDWLYRLLCIRYLFLSVIAWIWLHISDYNRYLLFSLGAMSLAFLLLIIYGWHNTQPLVYLGQWSSQNYPVYFWTLLLVFALQYSFSRIQHTRLCSFVCWLGRNSWEIFVVQMFILASVKSAVGRLVLPSVIEQTVIVIVGISAAIVPVVLLRKG